MNFKLTISLLAVLTMSACTPNHKHITDSSKAKATVMVTRLDERSGGTGVVLVSSETESLVLTNSHVCFVVENGGVVQNSFHKGFVTAYVRSEIHDLCLIKVNTNFEVATDIANKAPRLFSQASASGFPHLMPNLITKGDFSGKELVTIITGIRPCTPEDLNSDPMNAAICLFLGGFPVIRTYESQLIGATIQAGNSGSAVYNEDGEVAGLVFAGAGDLSYGIIVPQEYIYNFLNEELPELSLLKPSTSKELSADDLTRTANKKLKLACEALSKGETKFQIIEKFCRVNFDDLIYTK